MESKANLYSASEAAFFSFLNLLVQTDDYAKCSEALETIRREISLVDQETPIDPSAAEKAVALEEFRNHPIYEHLQDIDRMDIQGVPAWNPVTE